jgi:hypothetical protein
MVKACSRHGERRMHTGSSWESQKERDHEEDLDIDGRITLKTEWGGGVWTGLIWLRIGTIEGLLLTRL